MPQPVHQPAINELAIIGDRRTCALIDKSGCINWYCPVRFDQSSVFSLLIDTNGGYWTIEFEGKAFQSRNYLPQSSVLQTTFTSVAGKVNVVDYMPMGTYFNGICRKFQKLPVAVTNSILLKPEYGVVKPNLKLVSSNCVYFLKADIYLKASHPIHIDDYNIHFTIPAGEEGWAVLVDKDNELENIDVALIEKSFASTKNEWLKIFSSFSYSGIYEKEIEASFRAIKLMTFAENGGIIAAATTSLPEVINGFRNYDYRYVWLRDTAMIVGALTRANITGNEEQHFLDFICGARSTAGTKYFIPFYDLDFKIAPDIEELPLSGYRNSKPVQIGNGAKKQLQLDANGNVLMAAKLIYSKVSGRPHWDTIEFIADYLVEYWDKKDHGIWEEELKEHFTSSKVIVAKSLEFIADFASSTKQEKKWREAAKNIRAFIKNNCITNDGAYAVFAGSNDVDVTAALYPVWLFDDPESPYMLQTIKRIEAEYTSANLYHRRLELFDSKQEGVFLASCFWMAQYYIMCNQLEKATSIINDSLQYSTDLHFFAEEGNVETGEMQGNFPQTFVHASFIGAVLDLKTALEK